MPKQNGSSLGRPMIVESLTFYSWTFSFYSQRASNLQNGRVALRQKYISGWVIEFTLKITQTFASMVI